MDTKIEVYCIKYCCLRGVSTQVIAVRVNKQTTYLLQTCVQGRDTMRSLRVVGLLTMVRCARLFEKPHLLPLRQISSWPRLRGPIRRRHISIWTTSLRPPPPRTNCFHARLQYRAAKLTPTNVLPSQLFAGASSRTITINEDDDLEQDCLEEVEPGDTCYLEEGNY